MTGASPCGPGQPGEASPVARTGLRGLVRELMDFRVMDPSATVQSELRTIGGQGGAEAADRGGELSVTD